MSVKPKHGKGKYAYQAKISGKKQGEQAVISRSDNSAVLPAEGVEKNNIKPDIRTTRASNTAAAIPSNIGKIDLMYEIKRIGILAAVMFILLILLSVVLK